MALKKPGKQFQDEPCPLAKHNKGCMVVSARSNPVDIFALGIGYHKQPTWGWAIRVVLMVEITQGDAMMTVKQFIKKYVATQERVRAEVELNNIVDALENRGYNEAIRDVAQELHGLATELKHDRHPRI